MVKCSKGQVRRLKTALRWKGYPQQRQRIQMVLLRESGMTQPAIAEAMGVSLSTVTPANSEMGPFLRTDLMPAAASQSSGISNRRDSAASNSAWTFELLPRPSARVLARWPMGHRPSPARPERA